MAAIAQSLASSSPFLVVLQRDPQVDDPALPDLFRIGTLARVVQHSRAEEGQIHVVCQGV